MSDWFARSMTAFFSFFADAFFASSCGRTVGQLYHSTKGHDINASMVCAGHAWWYERYAPDNDLLENCQEGARAAPKGLWQGEDPVPPWKWRRR